MTRALQTISIALLVSSLYLVCLLQLIPFGPVIQEEIVPVLPFWILVSFGSYLLFKLGWGILTFNDVPDAHKTLMAEIEMAKRDLKSKGITID